MPVTQSAKRALRKDRRRTIVNLRTKRHLKKTIDQCKKNPHPENFRLVASLLDRAAKKRIIHPNKASRLKSRLSQKLKPITQAIVKQTKTHKKPQTPATKSS